MRFINDLVCTLMVLAVCTVGIDAAYDIHKAVSAATAATNLIHQRYEFDNEVGYQFFLGIANMNYNTWDILKHKFLTKILAGDEKFLMIFGGSSVTAGHDNYYNESFPFVAERKLAPALAALGVDLMVHNIAQGSNNCLPSEWCYSTMGGDYLGDDAEGRPRFRPADFLGWEQSFNCGRETKMFELIAREAGRQNAVLHIAASGSFPTPKDCAVDKDGPVPRISERWTPPRGDGGAAYVPDAKAVARLRTLLNEWNTKANPVARFIAPLAKYSKVGAHGFNIWTSSKAMCVIPSTGAKCDPTELIVNCSSNGGPRWMTKEVGRYGFTEYHHSHHPPAGQHLIRGEVLAYNYLHILLDAVYTIQDAKKDKKMTDEMLLKQYRRALQNLQTPDIPQEPISKPPGELAYAPSCFTNFEPHFAGNRMKLSEIVVGSGNVADQGWVYSEGVRRPDCPVCGYADKKPYFKAAGRNHSISLEFELRNGDSIYLCSYQQQLKAAMFAVELNVQPFNAEVERKRYIAGSRSDAPPVPWTQHELLYGDSFCSRLYGLPTGHHVVTVYAGNYDRTPTALTHLITF